MRAHAGDWVRRADAILTIGADHHDLKARRARLALQLTRILLIAERTKLQEIALRGKRRIGFQGLPGFRFGLGFGGEPGFLGRG